MNEKIFSDCRKKELILIPTSKGLIIAPKGTPTVYTKKQLVKAMKEAPKGTTIIWEEIK
ncbi:MAG TPA: hypothetical protein VMZ91_11960 [Candidatus Paceibacterota bacterium]|nr:hypothetical protein [Candidatus Paceibacterota bacterium]